MISFFNIKFNSITFKLLKVGFSLFLICSISSASTPRLILNGFVGAAGECPHSTHIITGWTMGFPVGGYSSSSSNGYSLVGGYWDVLAFAVEPPPPSITQPITVLEGATGEYESIEFPIEISGLKPPNERYNYNALVIAYTNGVELPANDVNQVSNQNLWSMSLSLNEGDVVEFALACSNVFGFSENKTILNITQIPEPVIIIALLLIMLFLFRKKLKIILLIIFTMMLFNSSKLHAVEFNYQGVITIEDGAYTGDGYFKFAIHNEASTTNYWANDGTPGGTPHAFVRISVSNGFFHTTLGSDSMLPIPRTLFSDYNNLYLSIWFSHLPGNNYYRLGPPQKITSVPSTINSDMLDGYDYQEVFYNVQTNSINLFLLRTGDVCSGQLQVSNLVSDTNVELPDNGKVYLNSAKNAYISSDNSGKITIYKENKPVFEIE